MDELLNVPVKEGHAGFEPLGTNAASCLQTCWQFGQLLIVDKKFMIGQKMLGKADR